MRNHISAWIERLRVKARSFFVRHSLPRWMVLGLDGGGIFLTYIFATILRHNFDLEVIDGGEVFNHAILVTFVYCGFEFIYRSFAGLIRHTTIRDIFNVVIATSSSLALLVVLSYISRNLNWNQLFIVPVSILLIHFVTINALLFITRILIKIVYEMVSDKSMDKKNILIFGAGAMGVLVHKVIESDTKSEYNIIAFLDNNKKLQSKKLAGIPVFSPNKLSKSFLEKHEIASMIFAINSLSPDEKCNIYKFAVDLGLEVLEVPALHSWLNGQFQLNQLKKINVQDLLTREPIQMNMKLLAKGLRERTILVTGAAGSIGSEIVRQLTKFRIGRLILVDNAETPMFNLESELQDNFAHAPVRTILADVTDEARMYHIFKEYRPEIVFHAAAYKHVPLMEVNPHESIRVNVGGTALLSKLSIEFRTKKFVMVSSDKAVNPTNVMGASKRMCEMLLQSRSLTPGNHTSFVITRFGNVLGSNGSVIPIFKKQIEEGGPVTVTHPEITRFFMTIPEACQLVLEAGFMGLGGEVFVFDMGEPVKIAELARRMIRLSGFVPDKDIQIEYTGLRPGEKLYEELLAMEEKTLPTYNPKVKVAEVARLKYREVLVRIYSLLRDYALMTAPELVKHMQSIVPEFESSNEQYAKKSPYSETVELGYTPD